MKNCEGCPTLTTCTSTCEDIEKHLRTPGRKESLLGDPARIDTMHFNPYGNTIGELREAKRRDAGRLRELIIEMDNLRHKAICALLLCDINTRDISSIMGCSERRIYQIIEEIEF